MLVAVLLSVAACSGGGHRVPLAESVPAEVEWPDAAPGLEQPGLGGSTEAGAANGTVGDPASPDPAPPGGVP